MQEAEGYEMFSDSQFSSFFFPIQLVYIQLIAVAAIKHVFALLLHSAHPLTLTTGNFIFEEAT